MAEPPRATVAVLSIGAMGVGVARLLKAHDYHVITNISGRSQATDDRAKSASIDVVATDEELVAQADYVLSIVPPRDAAATAKRVQAALLNNDGAALTQRKKHEKKELWYLDLNAIAPSTVTSIHKSFTANIPNIRFVDGGIIGGPPSPPAPDSETQQWTRPGIPLSGPHPLATAPVSGSHLAQTLNSKNVGEQIGAASGLKCCFAALSKGFTALALQSYTSAASLGVLGSLQEYLNIYNKGARDKAERSIVGCTTKAYRWVEEMNQIGQCFSENGPWEDQATVFREIAGVYQALADLVEKKSEVGTAAKAEDVVSALGLDLTQQKELVEEELERDDQ